MVVNDWLSDQMKSGQKKRKIPAMVLPLTQNKCILNYEVCTLQKQISLFSFIFSKKFLGYFSLCNQRKKPVSNNIYYVFQHI